MVFWNSIIDSAHFKKRCQFIMVLWEMIVKNQKQSVKTLKIHNSFFLKLCKIEKINQRRCKFTKCAFSFGHDFMLQKT